MAVAAARHIGLRHSVHIGCKIGVGFGQLALRRPLFHRRVAFQREAVHRYVRRRKFKRLAKRMLPLLDALMGQAVHQVDADVAEAGVCGHSVGIHSIGGGVPST